MLQTTSFICIQIRKINVQYIQPIKTHLQLVEVIGLSYLETTDKTYYIYVIKNQSS